jgi:hypothetical protein
MIKGFFSRREFHRALGCGAFLFDARQDLLVAHGLNDPGLYTRASELLQPYARTHAHAVVMLDVDWDGSPGEASIQARMNDHLTQAGWPSDAGCAVVIHPELENWVWQDSPHVTSALGFDGRFSALRRLLEEQGFWKPGDAKPHRSKEAVEWVLRMTEKRRSSAIYQQLASGVTTRRCSDPAFLALSAALSRWFPPT